MPIDDDDEQDNDDDEEWLLDYLQDVCNVQITLNISLRGEGRDERVGYREEGSVREWKEEKKQVEVTTWICLVRNQINIGK